MKSVVLKYGLIAGAILSGFMIATLPFTRAWMQQGYLEVVTISSFALALSVIFFGIRAYWNREGRNRFLMGLLVGILITLVAGVINSVTWEVLYQTSFQDFPERFVERNIQRMKEQGKTDAEIEVEIQPAREMMQSYKVSLPLRLFLSFTEIIPMGIVISLVSSTILMFRKRE